MTAGVNAKHFLPAIFASCAFALSLAANTWCESIEFTTNEAPGSDPSLTAKFGVFSRYGLTYRETDGEVIIRKTCVSYDGVSYDAKWKTVMAFAIIAAVIGGIVTIWTWIAPCFYMGKRFWKCGSVAFLFTCLCQGLTLLFLQSDACKNNPTINNVESEFNVDLGFPDECSRDWGYNCSIASVILWFASAVLMMVIPPAARPDPGPPETQTVTYTQTQQEDGTTAVTKEVVKGKYVPEEALDDKGASGGDMEAQGGEKQAS